MIPRVKIGNDITIEFSVFRNNSPEDFLDAQDIVISLKSELMNDVIIPAWSIVGNIITVKCLAEQQKICDRYVLNVQYKKPNSSRIPIMQPFNVDIQAFEIVERSEETSIGTTSENLTVETIYLNGVISVNKNGADGLSAYQVWALQPGNDGKTEEDFFEFLQKPAYDFIENIAFGYEEGKLIITY